VDAGAQGREHARTEHESRHEHESAIPTKHSLHSFTAGRDVRSVEHVPPATTPVGVIRPDRLDQFGLHWRSSRLAIAEFACSSAVLL
jgi:hypothetical protein